MIILTPIHSFEPGGVERVAIRLHRAWRALGVESQLVVGRDAGPGKDQRDDLSYAILAPFWLPTAAWETLWMILRLPAVIRHIRPDILFCPGNSYTIVAVAMKLLLGRKCPPVIAKISNDLSRPDIPNPVRFFYRYWLRLQGRLIDRFVALAPAMKPEIERLMEVSDARIDVIEDPALTRRDLEGMPRPVRPVKNATTFAAVGRLAAQKNYALLLRAFARMARPDDRLTLLGDGPERGKLEKLAVSLGIAGQVTFAGHVSDVRARLIQADVFVLSSEYEGVPAVILEALAAYLPVVATDCCVSMKGLLANPRHGIMTPKGDVDAFARAMDDARTMQFDADSVPSLLSRFTIETGAGRYLRAMRNQIRPVRSRR
ncbi:hypothetical protein GCM10023219_29440 [Stakelama sediminis]|uniref:Glycosyltransferase involved in cell wall biosynthesis n=1 Tax=Stakelama sediminis TaxID=463200 RepID=A0A840Z3J3_9SPHN|nr:glycosyltransferase [Stakelama sediminis]MBB5720256.1 glycosyltransferase involved in cell wall biosynthesis [Stakelama sediminis]